MYQWCVGAQRVILLSGIEVSTSLSKYIGKVFNLFVYNMCTSNGKYRKSCRFLCIRTQQP